ncbi:hypothetical protein BJV78DRAFT_1256563 [Lactifluus subvellereus]|nr:hypothetical protein BJV78DRAFT_1256563 [Lactifluus subvellereus]
MPLLMGPAILETYNIPASAFDLLPHSAVRHISVYCGAHARQPSQRHNPHELMTFVGGSMVPLAPVLLPPLPGATKVSRQKSRTLQLRQRGPPHHDDDAAGAALTPSKGIKS